MKYWKYEFHTQKEKSLNKNLKTENDYYKLKLVGERGQITIDKKIRDACNIEKGSPLLEIKVGKAIILVQVDNVFEEMTSRLKEAFSNTNMERDEMMKEIEENSRKRVVQKYYPDLSL